MANRVTSDEVKAIMNTSVENIDAFITSANVIVTDIYSDYDSTTISDDVKKEVERWLAAHFIAIRDPMVVREKIGEADQEYLLRRFGQTPLDATPYGQQAMAIDPTGRLRNRWRYGSLDFNLSIGTTYDASSGWEED